LKTEMKPDEICQMFYTSVHSARTS